MKVVIVEDEKPASDQLERLLRDYDPGINILQRLDTVEGAVSWFGEHGQEPDLVFMDIRLSDGMSFEIFQRIEIKRPVIFITAYNEYALEAFKVNSIDYLLKPFTVEELERSLSKLASMRENLVSQERTEVLAALARTLDVRQRPYKSRFMVKAGDHIRSFHPDQINLFYADGRTVYLVTGQGREYIVEYRMEELEEILDPEYFYRINRTFIVSILAIREVIIHSNSRLKIIMNQDFDRDLIVSREKVNSFKKWFGMRE